MKFKRQIRRLGMFAWEAARTPLDRVIRPDHVKLLHYVILNWGDLINPVLMRRITSKPVVSVDIDVRRMKKPPVRPEQDTVIMGIGSILQYADCQTEVWGSGLWSDTSPIQPPKRVHAVRGPLTRQSLLNRGISCPEVFGDPALLLPKFFPNNSPKKYDLGIVPHRTDINHPSLRKFIEDPSVCVIDLRKPGVLNTLELFQQCKHVVSSSLHGLIVPDAYGIPSKQIELFGSVPGGQFKFNDYYGSLNFEAPAPTLISQQTTKEELIDACSFKSLDALDLDELLNVCPVEKMAAEQS